MATGSGSDLYAASRQLGVAAKGWVLLIGIAGGALASSIGTADVNLLIAVLAGGIAFAWLGYAVATYLAASARDRARELERVGKAT